MSSTPSSPLPPPLGINYDSDEDMNVDSDNDIARGQDIDADGESIDEEVNVDHLHDVVHNDTRLSSTARHHSVRSISFLIVAPLIIHLIGCRRFGMIIAYIHFFCLSG
jgi:hypothetical protein